jgi:hypothetical protein
MPNAEKACRDFGPIEEAREAEPLLAILLTGAALQREREQADIEAQDALSLADEALVMG